MNRYPHVLSEIETLRQVCVGHSLARYGDGEFKLAHGRPIKSQHEDRALRGRLEGILRKSGACLVGIPNLLSPTPKMEFWKKYHVEARMLDPKRQYASAFVSRLDSAPWLDTSEYWGLVESLWRGLRVTLVRGSGKSFTAQDLIGATEVAEIVGPVQHAWSEYARLLERVKRTKPERVLLALGPTATVLAVDLCAAGIHAVDIGHLGLFWKKHQRGEPMIRTDADKVAV